MKLINLYNHPFVHYRLMFYVIFLVNSVILFKLKSKFNCMCSENDYNFPNVSHSKPGQYHLMSTSKLNRSVSHHIGMWSPNIGVGNSSITYVQIDRRKPYEQSKFFGFGSTFTDADLNIFPRMSSMQRDHLFESYFSANGLNFELLRVPINKYFATKRKMYANNLSQRPLNEHLKIVAAVRPSERFGSTEEVCDANSNHIIKLIKSLCNDDKIEMLSIDFNCSEQNVTVAANQIRTLIAAFDGIAKCMAPKICLTDCTRQIGEPWLFQLEKSQIKILDKIDMILMTNQSVAPERLCRAYKKYHKPISFAEIKLDQRKQMSTVQIDSWQKTEQFIDTIMALLRQNIVGYFGNSLISKVNGRHTANTLITFDERKSKICKQSNFYAMAHFSRHILPTSKRLAATICGPMAAGIQTVAYLRPDANILILLYNPNGMSIPAYVVDKRIGTIDVTLQPKSINSILYSIHQTIHT